MPDLRPGKEVFLPQGSVTLQDSVVAAMAREEWRKKTETLLFKSELTRKYQEAVKNYIAKGCTPGVSLEQLVRLAQQCKDYEEIIEKL